MSRSQSKAEYGRFAHLVVGGIEWLLSQWQELTGGEETDLHSHAPSGGGSGALLYAEVTLDDDDLRNLPTAKATILAAQGVGTVVVPVHLALFRPPSFVPYSLLSPTTLRIAIGIRISTVGSVQDVLMGDRTGQFLSWTAFSLGEVGDDLSNQPVQIDDGDNSAPYDGGDAGNTMLVCFWYRTVTLPV